MELMDSSRKRSLDDVSSSDLAPPAKRVTDENADISVEDDGSSTEDNTIKISAAFRTIIEVPLYNIVIIRTVIYTIQCLGEDPNREGLIDTPARAAKAMLQFCSGYKKTPEEVVGSGKFSSSVSGNLVFVKDIELYSLCEHHMVPFFGKVTSLQYNLACEINADIAAGIDCLHSGSDYARAKQAR
jgi:hypothetical protein